MSLSPLPDVARSQKLSTAGAFQTAPTLVKTLVAFLYLEALLRLGQAVPTMVGLSDDSRDIMVNARVVFLGLALALIPFLLGKHIARGAHSMWLLTLVLVVVEVPFDVHSVLAGLTVTSLLNVIFPFAVLALLLTLFVRQHCTKK
jgi:hypothetical protein